MVKRNSDIPSNWKSNTTRIQLALQSMDEQLFGAKYSIGLYFNVKVCWQVIALNIIDKNLTDAKLKRIVKA